MSGDRPLVDFMLPGRWWRVSLGADEELRRSARAMAVESLGRADQLAQVRSELVAQVLEAARGARSAGGTEFYFGLEIAPGMPLPMSLTVYWPELPDGLSRRVDARLGAESLADSLRQSSGDEVSVVDHDVFGVVRVVGSRAADAEATGRLDVSYWVLSTTSSKTLLMSFSTTLVDFREAVLELGDAIVSSVMWSDDGDVQRV